MTIKQQQHDEAARLAAIQEETGVDVAVYQPAPVASAALAAFAGDEWAGVDDGLVGWEHVGFSVPRLVSDMRPGGGWTDEATGEKHTAVEVVLLAMQPGRAYWPDPFGTGSEAPVCRSMDMTHPDPSSPILQAKVCASCPHSQWVRRPGERDEPPACKVRINALVYDPNRQAINRVGFGGTAISEVRKYVSALKAGVPPRPPISVVTVITLEEVSDGKMRWLEPRFARGDDLSYRDAQPLVALRDQLVAQWRSALADDLARPEADMAAVVDDGPFGRAETAAEGTTVGAVVDEVPF